MRMICARVLSAWKRLMSAALLSCVLSAISLEAAPADLPAGFPEVALKSKARGEVAISALGNKMAGIAAFHRMSEGELKRILRKDKSLWVDEKGRLIYICDFKGAKESGEAVSANVSPIDDGAVDRTQTFLLHSRKGASRVVYLDFDGHDASTTSWGTDAIAVPFDLDGNESNFSVTERDRIQYIWQRVAEDFAMYDIDITTEDPGLEGLRKSGTSDTAYGIRVVIGGASGDWYGSAGGVAFLNSFDSSSDLPCWVFPGSLGNSEKNIAEATSHEVGHTLALNHDGDTLGAEYYRGHGNWAPIMGVGYSEPITQWSKGEYTAADNLEDDLAKMLTEGIAYRADDNGNSTASATLLTGVNFSTNGVIERTTDVDFFKFQTGAGRTIITVTPAPRGPNLHISLSLYNSVGSLLMSSNVADTSAGVLPVTISTILPTGTYYFSVDGIGQGVPANTGYSEYGSIGQYIISGTLISNTYWIPTAAGAFSWTQSANWLSGNVPDSADVVARLNNNLVGDQVVSLDRAITVGSLDYGDVNGTHTFTLQNGIGGSLTFRKTSGDASIFKPTGSNDVITANIFLLSNLIVSNGSPGDLTISAPMTGTGGVTKSGLGNVIFDGPQNYSGPTTIAEGTLQLTATASLANSPQIHLDAGAIFDASLLPTGWTLENDRTLSGSGVVLGNVTVAPLSIIAQAVGKISPGGASAGTLSISNDLFLNSGSTLNFDLADSTEVGGGTNDLLVVGGDLHLPSSNQASIRLNFLNQFPESPGTYTLIRYGGTLFGSASDLNVPNLSTRYAFTIDTSVPGEIRLIVSGGPESLVWQGDALLNQWNLSATNWQISGSSATFAQLDDVLFDDNGSEVPAVNLGTALQPNSVLVAGAKNYTFSGAGKISGPTGIMKQGSGMLTVNTANDFTGPISIAEGMLKTGNPKALGSAVGPTTVASGARLDLNGQNLGDEAVTVAGGGLSGTGALISSSGVAQTNALRFVTLAGDATVGGVGRWDIRANPTATFTGNNFALTKMGLNEFWLVEVGATGLGDINLNQGFFGVQGSTTLGNVANTLTAAAGTRVGIWNSDINVLTKNWVLNGATVQSLSGNNTIAGPMTINGANTFSSVSLFNVQSQISGAGSLTKIGAGGLTLSGANSFAGNLSINTGTLIAGSVSALGNTTGSTIVANEARLDVNGLNLGAEPVIVQGNGLGNAGAIVNSGAQQLNALRFVTMSNNTSFGGIGRWDIRANPTGNLVGNNFTLTKTSKNTVYLVGIGNTALGGITISEGVLGFQGTSTLGNPASTLSIASGATLEIYATGTNILAKTVSMSTGKISNENGVNTMIGTTSLSGSNAFDITGGSSLTMGGNIGGSGSFWKHSATGTLLLTGTNAYSGMTVVSGGILQVGNGGLSGTLGTGTISNNTTITFNRSNNITVGNLIRGTGSINQNGSGMLTLSGINNSYSGSTVINSGTLAVGSDSALGSSLLNFNGNNGVFRSANNFTRSLGNEIVFGGTTATFGGEGSGDLIFNGAGVNNGTLTKTLIVSNANTTINNAITNRGAIIKDGPGTLVLGGNNTFTNTTTVNAGTLRIDAENRLGLNPAVYNPGHLTLNGGALQTLANVTIDDANRGITLGVDGGSINVGNGATLTMHKPLTGPGDLTKTGAGTLLTTVTNSFSGATLISSGTLALSGSASIAATPTIDLAAAAILDVSGVTEFKIQNSQTLTGLGTVNGSAQIDGTISPTGSAGRLGFNDDLSLRGSALMNLTKTGSIVTNDTLTIAGALSLGGSLVVTAAGDALSAGDIFQLFSAGSINDTFASVTLPPLPAPLFWETNNLTVTGTIHVAEPLPPEILPAVLEEGNILFSVLGQTGLDYILQSASSLAEPIEWTGVSTNTGTGEILSISIPIDPAGGQLFFRFVVD